LKVPKQKLPVNKKEKDKKKPQHPESFSTSIPDNELKSCVKAEILQSRTSERMSEEGKQFFHLPIAN
jgi:hypothetical protein